MRDCRIWLELYRRAEFANGLALVICGQQQLPQRTMFGPAIWVLLDGEFQLRNGRRVFVLSHVSAGERFMTVLPRGIRPKEFVIFSNRGVVLALREINAGEIFADGWL